MECEVSNPAALLGEVENDTFKQIHVSYFLKIKLLNVPCKCYKVIIKVNFQDSTFVRLGPLLSNYQLINLNF